VDADEVIGMTVQPMVAAAVALPVAVIVLIVITLCWLTRKHRLMYAEIYARDVAGVQARAAERAAVYDQTPVPRPSVDGPATAGAGTPDSAPVVAPQRVHIEMGGSGRHGMVA
jgi:energy-converting hydrogenase Eha subunit F